MRDGWIGVDFDGTLAHYGTWVDAAHCGHPIQPMVDRVQAWLKEGRQVRVFTARVFPITEVITGYPALNFVPAEHRNSLPYRYRDAVEAAHAIQAWCRQYIGVMLPITCVKDYAMIELYDDRCVQVRPNTGELVGNSTRGLAKATPAMDGEALYNLYKQELWELSVDSDEFGSLDVTDQTAWHCVAAKLEQK